MAAPAETSPVAWIGPIFSVVVRPDLWPTALRVVLILARPAWWRSRPRLPLPDPHYWHFRSLTAFGGDGAVPRGAEVVTYLEWCRAWPRVSG